MRKIFFIFGLLALAAANPLFAQDTQQMPASSDSAYKKSLLEGINTSDPDVRPLVSADGNKLYFSRQVKSRRQKKEIDQDIYVAHKDPASGAWGEPERLSRNLNNNRSNAVVSINPDKEELILYNTYKKTENAPLVRTVKEEGKWKAPEEIAIQDYQNFSPYADFFLDFNHEVLLLAIKPSPAKGEQDLYVSFPDGENGWTKPVNMGPVLNSDKADFAPFMGADGRTLLFSSYGHNSLGGSDIFMSVRLDDSWKNWSQPVNLGPAINTRDDENYFSVDANFEYLYYTSQKARKAEWDMLQVKLPADFTAINGPVLSGLNSEEIKKIMDSGHYTISPTGSPTNAEGVAFAGWPSGPEPEPATEEAELPVENPEEEEEMAVAEDESIPARLRGFKPADEVNNLSAEAVTTRDYLQQILPEMDLAVRNTGNTTEFKLVQDILFGFNSIDVNGEYQQRLNNIARVLKEKENLKVQLIGHTDNIGSEEVNERVSRLRVNSVRNYLAARGINDSRLEVIGAGQAEPIAPNETSEGRNMNRRVETIIRSIDQ